MAFYFHFFGSIHSLYPPVCQSLTVLTSPHPSSMSPIFILLTILIHYLCQLRLFSQFDLRNTPSTCPYFINSANRYLSPIVLDLHRVDILYRAIDSSITSFIVHCGTLRNNLCICLTALSDTDMNFFPLASTSNRLMPYTIVAYIVAFINNATMYGVAFRLLSFIYRLLIFFSIFSLIFSKCKSGSSSLVIHTPKYL